MLERFTEKVKQLREGYLRKRRLATSRMECCISIAPQEILLGTAYKQAGKTELRVFTSYPYEKETDIPKTLALLTKENKLEKVGCSWLLQSTDYHLVLTEALPVPPSEFQAAIRWKIKDSIPFPAAEAVFDNFLIPPQKTVDPRKMMMVVAARSGFLDKMSKQICASGLDLTTIDIPELCLRNVTALFEKDEKSTALVYMQEKDSQMIITHKKSLYFTRRLESGVEFIDSLPHEGDLQGEMEQKVDKFALEFQRSFDYYRSQWRLPLPARVFFMLAKPISSEKLKHLLQRLTVSTQTLDINEMIPTREKMSFDQEGKYLSVIGGLLREEGDTNATAN